MVNSCAVISCTNRSNRDRKSFYVIPTVIIGQGEQTRKLSEKRRAQWLVNINRERFTPSRHTRVCSEHFISGKPSALYQDTDVDWAPSLKLGHKKLKRKSLFLRTPEGGIRSQQQQKKKKKNVESAQSLLTLSNIREPEEDEVETQTSELACGRLGARMESTCPGCDWAYTKLISEIQEQDKLFSFLVSHNLICTTLTCPSCQSEIQLNQKSLVFRCDKIVKRKKNGNDEFRCSTMESALKGSFLEHSHLKLETIILFTYFFVSPFRKSLFVAQKLNASPTTVAAWFSFCQEVLVWHFMEESKRLGGPGKIVEVHEAKFGKKFIKGNVTEGKWVIGGVQRDNKKVFFAPVNDLSQSTLVLAIKQYVLPGTTVITDSWSSFKNLRVHGYRQKTLDNTDKYVDPDTGEYYPKILKDWKDVKGQDTGRRKAQYFESYLAELLFKKMYMKQSDRFHHFLLLAGQLYSPQIPRNQEKYDKWMKLLKREDRIITDSSMANSNHYRPVKDEDSLEKTLNERCNSVWDDAESLLERASPKAKCQRMINTNSEEPSPNMTTFRPRDTEHKIKSEDPQDEHLLGAAWFETGEPEDIKQEELEIKKEKAKEGMEENFEIDIKEEKVLVMTEEELKEEVVEEEPIENITAMPTKECEVPHYHELMEEAGAPWKKRRRAPEAAAGTAVVERATVTMRTCHEPYQNTAENIGIDQTGLSHGVQKKQLGIVSPKRSQLLNRDTGAFTYEQEKCLDTRISHCGLSCSVEEKEHLGSSLPGSASQVLSKDELIFTAEQEGELVKCFQKAKEWFGGVMLQDARKLVYNFAVKYDIKCYQSWDKYGLADVEWLKKFLKRHPCISVRNPKRHILSIGLINHILNTVPKLINVTISTKDKSEKCRVRHSYEEDSPELSESQELRRDHCYASQDKVYQIISTKKNVGYARHNWLFSDTQGNEKQNNNLLNIPVSLGDGSGSSGDDLDIVRESFMLEKRDAPKNHFCSIINTENNPFHVKHEWLYSKFPEKEVEDDNMFNTPVSLDEDSGNFDDSQSDVSAGETVFVDVQEELFTPDKNEYY